LIQIITSPLSDVQITKIPVELRALPQGVLWRGENRINEQTGEVKVSKVPIDPHTLKHASSTDPRTWGTFEDCCHKEFAVLTASVDKALAYFAMHSETVLCLFGLYCEESGLALKQAA
jgi:hypothetical protein